MRYNPRSSLGALFCLLLLAPTLAGAADPESSIVTLKVTVQGYDSYSPWRTRAPAQSEIQGCLIADDVIVTVAYPLVGNVLVEATKHGSPRRYPAQVILSDPVAGIALLTVTDESFFSDLAAVPLVDSGTVPRDLRIARWETGGVLREFTASVIKTTVDYFTPLGATLAHVLTTEMDRGGSGEAVFADGKLLGLAYYLEPSSKNLKVISAAAIRRLLADVADGRYDGYPSSWEYTQGLEGDENLKRYLGMAPDETGVLVTAVPPLMSGSGILEVDDVILEVDGQRIDDSGLYRSAAYGPLHYESLLFLGHQVGETVSLRVLRRGKRVDLTVPLLPLDDEAFLVPIAATDSPPEYVVFGGLVFQELTRSYLQDTWGNDWWRAADGRLLFLYNTMSLFPEPDRRRIVILNRVLPHAVNAGYQSEVNLVLETVSGTRIRDLRHLATLLEEAQSPYAVFAFTGGDRLVLSFEAARRAEKEIMSSYGIPASAMIRPPGAGDGS